MIDDLLLQGVDIVSKILLVNAKTAPKSIGRDDIVIDIVDNIEDRKPILEKAKEIAKRSGFGFYERDAVNCEKISHIILIGYKLFYHRFNCGFCGFPTCDVCEKKGGVCAISVTDSGIAIGSLVKLSSIFGVDNRVMLSIGQAAKESDFFKEKVGGAFGIPLSATTKNPFFDRKK